MRQNDDPKLFQVSPDKGKNKASIVDAQRTNNEDAPTMAQERPIDQSQNVTEVMNPVDNTRSQVSSPNHLNNASADDLEMKKRNMQHGKDDQSNSNLNISPRGPRDCSMDDLFLIKNNLQNNGVDLVPENIHTISDEASNHLTQEDLYEGQGHNFLKTKSTNKRGKKVDNPIVVTRAHSKK